MNTFSNFSDINKFYEVFLNYLQTIPELPVNYSHSLFSFLKFILRSDLTLRQINLKSEVFTTNNSITTDSIYTISLYQYKLYSLQCMCDDKFLS
jgi:hypothetical protein